MRAVALGKDMGMVMVSPLLRRLRADSLYMAFLRFHPTMGTLAFANSPTYGARTGLSSVSLTGPIPRATVI